MQPKHNSSNSASDHTSTHLDLSFHAVSVRCDQSACPAAQALGDTRWLSREAPALPLEGCDRPEQCDCRYRHFDDRRSGPRRRTEGALSPPAADDFTDTRTIRGRRKTDSPDHVLVAEEEEEDGAEDESSLVADTYYGYVRKDAG